MPILFNNSSLFAPIPLTSLRLPSLIAIESQSFLHEHIVHFFLLDVMGGGVLDSISFSRFNNESINYLFIFSLNLIFSTLMPSFSLCNINPFSTLHFCKLFINKPFIASINLCSLVIFLPCLARIGW